MRRLLLKAMAGHCSRQCNGFWLVPETREWFGFNEFEMHRRQSMNVPLLDLKAQYRPIKAEIDAAIAEVMESQQFILGPKVQECEAAIAKYSNCSHAVGVSSGTDALL